VANRDDYDLSFLLENDAVIAFESFSSFLI